MSGRHCVSGIEILGRSRYDSVRFLNHTLGRATDFVMKSCQRLLMLIVILASPGAGRFVQAQEPGERLRVLIETDAGGDPDDEQSLVRFLLYANEWDVEGILCNRPQATDGENLNSERTGVGVVKRLVQAYEACAEDLRRHDPRYPAPGVLSSRVICGYDAEQSGKAYVLGVVDAPDPRPVWFCNWGTIRDTAPSSLQLALDDVLATRGEAGYAAFKSRLRLSSDDQFGEHVRRSPAFPLWVDTFRPELERRRWYHRFSAVTARAGGFDLQRDVLREHGPLGALYPTNTTHVQKEGDSMTFLYLVPTGMNDPEHPEWGSWAGRYGPNSTFPGQPYYWANVEDSWNGTRHRENTLARWAVDLQNDFRARMDWCVQPVERANHPPQPVLQGVAGSQILRRPVTPGAVILSAEGSTDPDGDSVRFEWMVYPEPERGSRITIEARGAQATVQIPRELVGQMIPIVLTVRDDGQPPLARYRRILLECRPAE